MIKKFEGVLPALVTPLENDNVTVKKDAVKKIVDMQDGQRKQKYKKRLNL